MIREKKRCIKKESAILFFLLMVIGSLLGHRPELRGEVEEMQEITVTTMPAAEWTPHQTPDGEMVYTKTPDWALNYDED